MTFRRRFRSLTAFAAEWCALPGERGGKRRAAGEKVPWYENSPPPPFFFPLLTPYAMHHSASDDRNWRNLLRSTTNFPKTTWTELEKLQFIIFAATKKQNKQQLIVRNMKQNIVLEKSAAFSRCRRTCQAVKSNRKNFKITYSPLIINYQLIKWLHWKVAFSKKK